QAQLVEASPRRSHYSERRGARLSRRADDRALQAAERLAHPSRAARYPRGYLAVRVRQRLPRHAHLQGAWGLGLLGPGAIAHPRQDLLAQPRWRHHSHGAELARARRADREIRHRGAEGALPAAPCAWRGDSLLRAHWSVLRL